ncbi:MAG: hypothetical protein H0T89_13555 [Deltaproteobacteria bacterium]|nr:hypothetical protein [Deltaproteobacteria bacterium]MDQ3295434.1 hypothetical protein [Myxococcota bacterium]
MKIIDERLPGRSDAEDLALRDLVRKVEISERKRENEVSAQMPQTDRGRVGRTERMAEQQQSVKDAMAALKTKLDQLVEERLALLPADATDIRHGDGGGDLRDDRRYPVVCTSAGQTVSLGGCSTQGPAEQRVAWFRDAAERRRNQ